MGIIIDTEKVEDNQRCLHVKKPIIYINIIGSSISLFLLLFCSFRMYFGKKKLSFMTLLILLIFSSEIVNTISKLLQLVKYYFRDKRDHKDFESGNTPRGIICQIQIVTAIYSDLCSLLGTLLLSLRCNDVIKNKKRFFDKGKNSCLSIICVIVASIILSMLFLLIDKLKDEGISYRYDLRDRCSYWCWLTHEVSLICFGLFFVILSFNIYFALKTYCFLKKGYNKLREENDISYEKISNKKHSNSKSNSIPLKEERKFNNLTKEEKTRIEELRIMKNKSMVYPLVTIFIWTIITTYRIVDDITMNSFDKGNPTDTKNMEEEKLKSNKFLRFCVEFFLVFHAFLSSTRGIFYAFSFLVFEEKLFFNFFRNCCCYFCIKEIDVEECIEKKEIIRTSNRSSSYDLKEENENEEQDNNSKTEEREMSYSDYVD